MLNILFKRYTHYVSHITVTCPSGWTENPHSGTCIKLYKDKKSWTDARAICQAAGGDLVKIADDSMNQFIWGEERRIEQ